MSTATSPGDIPDYQASALLMAIYLRGMDQDETLSLTMRMLHSGDAVDLSTLGRRHRGQAFHRRRGDKTSLAVVPLLAAMDPGPVFVAKMSGRGLATPAARSTNSRASPASPPRLNATISYAIVREHGGPSSARPETWRRQTSSSTRCATSPPRLAPSRLIASSIMSKKLASGSDCILLDVKVGSGAFMKTVPQAVELAQTMVAIGRGAGRRVRALVTNMDRPLGRAIGNTLEVIEVARMLQGRGPADLEHECLMLAGGLMR